MSIVEIPLQALSPEALIGVIDAFILREGTDYGDRVYTLDEKRDRVRRLLESNKAQIQFHSESEFIDIALI